MGSMTFNGTTTIVDADNSTVGLGAKTVGPWSACVWAKWATAGEGSVGNFFFADTNALIFRLHTASNVIRLRQAGSGAQAEVITDALFSTGVWYCLVGTFDGVNCHLYYSNENDRRLREATYTTNTSIGTFTTWGTRVYVGNNSSASGTFDGQMREPAVLDWVMDRNDMDRYLQGDLPVLFARGNPRLYFSFDNRGHGLTDSSRRGQTITSPANPVASGDQPRGVQFDWDWARASRRHGVH